MEIVGRIILAAMLFWMTKIDFDHRPQVIPLLISKKIPKPTWAFYSAVALKFLGGVSILFHIFTPFFAFLLGLFFIGASCLFQDFWRASSEEKQIKTLLFVSNVTIAGGMFLLV
jgi:uncharacterized membrane protein YphA (DoxX/SURF4 family)